MHAALTMAYALLCIALIYRLKFFKNSGLSPRFLCAVFGLKLLFGFGLWAIYTYHYAYRDTSDAFRYFDAGMVVFSALAENPLHYLSLMTGIGIDAPEVQTYFTHISGWSKTYNYGIPNDNPTIIRINAFMALFSQGYYHVHTVLMCMISMVGLTAMQRGLLMWFPGRPRAMALAVFAIPTVLFWGSGVLKEAPLLLFLGLVVWAFAEACSRGWTKAVVARGALGLLGLVALKMYVLVMWTPGLCFLVWISLTGPKRALFKFGAVHVCLAGLALLGGSVLPGGDILHVLERKQTDFYNVAQMAEAGSTVDLPPIEGGLSVVKAAPGALYNAYFRPDVTEVESPFYGGLALENAALILLILLALYKGGWQSQHRAWRWALLSFVLLYGLMLGVTVPILGAVVRYKMPVMPLIVGLCFSGGLGLSVEGFLEKRFRFMVKSDGPGSDLASDTVPAPRTT